LNKVQHTLTKERFDLSTNLCGFNLRNPIILASGFLGSTGELLKRVAATGVGAVVTKTVGMVERQGYHNPTVIEPMKNVVLNAMGLPNPGYREFAKEIAVAKESGIPVIVSIFGDTPSEFATVASGVEHSGADMIEINVSCPHVNKMSETTLIGQDPEETRKVLTAVRKITKIPLIVKLSPNVTDITKFVTVAVECDMDAICAINTLQALEIDPILERPVLGNLVGGQSGPSIRCIALRKVADIALCLKQMREKGELTKEIPVIGVGGIRDAEDAVRFILVGATCVQVGSAILYEDIKIFPKIIKGLEEHMKKKGYKKTNEFKGKALQWLEHATNTNSN
jgi:dihydroorotate dehydrogenase (NAD+) catalytic subunit